MNVPLNVNPTQTAAYTVNPLTGHKVRFAGLFMTHPSMNASNAYGRPAR